MYSWFSIFLLSSFSWEESLRFTVMASAGARPPINPHVRDEPRKRFFNRLLYRLLLQQQQPQPQERTQKLASSTASTSSSSSSASSEAASSALPTFNDFIHQVDSLIEHLHTIFLPVALFHPALYFFHHAFRMSLMVCMCNPALMGGQPLSTIRVVSTSFLHVEAVVTSLCSLLDEINAWLHFEDESSSSQSSPSSVRGHDTQAVAGTRISSLSAFLLHLKVLMLHYLGLVVSQYATARRRRLSLETFQSHQVRRDLSLFLCFDTHA